MDIISIVCNNSDWVNMNVINKHVNNWTENTTMFVRLTSRRVPALRAFSGVLSIVKRTLGNNASWNHLRVRGSPQYFLKAVVTPVLQNWPGEDDGSLRYLETRLFLIRSVFPFVGRIWTPTLGLKSHWTVRLAPNFDTFDTLDQDSPRIPGIRRSPSSQTTTGQFRRMGIASTQETYIRRHSVAYSLLLYAQRLWEYSLVGTFTQFDVSNHCKNIA